MNNSESGIHDALNIAWWRKPRRTRNRIMLVKKEDYCSYRGLDVFKSRAFQKGKLWNIYRDYNDAYHSWKPPRNSYDSMTDES